MRNTTFLAALAASALTLLIPDAAAAKYKVAAVDGGGAVSGKVVFKGTAPAQAKWQVSKEEDVCGSGEITGPVMKVGGGGALQGAVVYVAEVKAGKDWDRSKLSQEIDQKGCRFVMKGVVYKMDDKLVVKNSDPVLHNVHGYELIGRARRSLFNIGQPPSAGDRKTKAKVKRSHVLKIECDAHNFMHTWAFGAGSPYFQVTGADGAFSIDQVPPGDYELLVWHPALADKVHKQKVSIAAGAKVASDVTLK